MDSEPRGRLVDIEDEEVLDKLAMKLVEKKMKERQINRKRTRRSSSTDEEANNDANHSDDEEVSLDMLVQVKQDLKDGFTKIHARLEGFIK